MYYIETETTFAASTEHHEPSSAELDMNLLYQWLDRPVTDEDITADKE